MDKLIRRLEEEGHDHREITPLINVVLTMETDTDLDDSII